MKPSIILPLTLLLTTPTPCASRTLAILNTNPFLPDYPSTTCKNDEPAPEWMASQPLPKSAEKCCEKHFGWDKETCLANSRLWALENPVQDEEQEEEQSPIKYWADTTEGICKVDGPNRPSWSDAYQISYEECCEKYLSWSKVKCLAAKPPEEDMVQNSSPVNNKEYYPDSIKGYCKEDGPNRPSWISVVEKDYITCCNVHFASTTDTLSNCLSKMPSDAATPSPTSQPTKRPKTLAPTPELYFTPSPEAMYPTTSSPTTSRPTSLPTSNADCSDQSLTKSQCESNPKCIWHLKNGIACTYRAWIMPTQKPTPNPTHSPVKTYEFYMVPRGDVCVFNDEDRPSWITKIYTDWDECCDSGWDGERCKSLRPAELDQGNMQENSSPTNDSNGGGGDGEYVIIDISMTGSLTLSNVMLPSQTSAEWNDLKRVLTKSLILTLAYDGRLVHPNVEVELYSLGGMEFSWRRGLVGSVDEEEEEQEETTLNLRGAQVNRRLPRKKKTKKPSSKPSPTPPVPVSFGSPPTDPAPTASYPLKFAVKVPTQCDTACQSSTGYLGQAEADAIKQHLQSFVKNNYFGVQLKREGKAVGLFLDNVPKASDASLEYYYASKASGSLTWSPSTSPTPIPTWNPTPSPTVTTGPTTTSSPTGRIYYPDYENHICKADGNPPQYEVNFFTSLKDCCKFDWIDTKTCLKLSFTENPTPSPTGKPSFKPTKPPKTRRPTPLPTKVKTPKPTPQPFHSSFSPIAPGSQIYYPDLTLGVCKSDGLHGQNPYTFSSPEACCNNNYMDYNICMAHASLKRYIPNPWVGYCQEAEDTQISGMYVYSTPEECCETGMVGDYDICLINTRNQAGPSPTSSPTKSPVGSSLPGNYYPDFASGYCKSDGMHANKPYVFASAEKCCRNAVMVYEDCLRESIERFNEAPPSTAEPTNRPTRNPPTPVPTSLAVSPAGNYYPDFTAGYCKSGTVPENVQLVFPSAEKCCKNNVMIYANCLSLSIEHYQETPVTTTTTTTTGQVYYPDLILKVCKSDGNQGQIPYIFNTAQECCQNGSMEYARCMAYAAGYKFYPEPLDGYCRISDGTESIAYIYDSPEECCDTGMMGDAASCMLSTVENLGDSNEPQVTAATTTTIAAKVYYPDMVLKVCKSDGNHGQIPYTFTSAQACCNNGAMNYDRCMAYAAGYKYFPQPLDGYCRISNPNDLIAYIFDSPEDCCGSGIMGNADSCLLLSVQRLGESNEPDTPKTTTTTTTTTTTSTTTAAGAKVYYPDMVLKVCKSDGNHGQIPYTFSTAHACCNNNYMDYGECMAYATGDGSYTSTVATASSSTTSATTTTTTTSTTVKNTPAPTQKPTPKPTVKFTVPPVVSSAIDARKFTDEVTDSFENGLDAVFPWSTTPDTPWTIDNTKYRDGVASAVSSPISKGQTSDLYVAVNSDHGGIFFFSLKSDVQMPFSGFYVNIDDKSKMGYTFPTPEWRDLSVSVDGGQHVLMFRTWVPSIASTPSSTTTGTVNIDKVSFQPFLIESFEKGELSWGAAEFIGGDWVFDTSKSHGGTTSLLSPSLSSQSSMSFEFTTASKGSTVEFYYFADIKNSDKFEFKIDGFAVLEVTSAFDQWKMMPRKSLVPGTHTLEWVYHQPANDNGSKVWIDDIRIVPIGV